jgi:hypothetical protein
MLNGIGTSAMSTFDRMKEKVEVLEVQAEVSKNLIGAAKESSLEAKFKVVYTHHIFNIMVLHGQMLECLLYNPPPSLPLTLLTCMADNYLYIVLIRI